MIDLYITPRHILRLILRNWWMFLLFPIIISPLGYVASLFISNTYKSDVTILVKSQGLASERTKATIGNNIKQRIANIQDKVLSRTELKRIIKKLELYVGELEKKPIEDVIPKMRKNINLKIYASVFKLSYSGKDQPEKIMKVVDEIASLFIKENIEYKRNIYAAYQFLQKKLDELQQRIQDVENEIAAYKQKYLTALPEYLNTNFNARNNYSRLLESNSQIILANSKEKNAISNKFVAALEATIANLKRMLLQKTIDEPVDEKFLLSQEEQRKKQETVLNLQKNINIAQQSLQELLLDFTEDYPGVKQQKQLVKSLEKKLTKEIAGIKKEPAKNKVDTYVYSEKKRKQFSRYINLLKRYKLNYAEYNTLQNKLYGLRVKRENSKDKKLYDNQWKLLLKNIAKKEKYLFRQSTKDLRVFPELLQMIKQLYEFQTQSNYLNQQHQRYYKSLLLIEKHIEETPEHERNLSILTRKHRALLKEDEILLRDSQKAYRLKELEQDKRGGEFVILDPAYLPGIPRSTKVIIFTLVAVIVGLMIAGCLAVARDILFPRIEDLESVKKVVQKMLSMSIPNFTLDIDNMTVINLSESKIISKKEYRNSKNLSQKQQQLLAPISMDKGEKYTARQYQKLQQNLHEQDLPVQINKIHMNKQIEIRNQTYRVLTILEENLLDVENLNNIELQPIPNMTAFFAPSSHIANIYRKIRFQIFPREEKSNNKVLFTSVLENEGKTTTSLNIAGAIATGMVNNAIWIECNFHNPLDELFEEQQPGLANVLSGEINLSEVVKETQYRRLKIIPAGQSHLNPSELLSSKAMQRVIKILEMKYPDHFLIFDGPAIFSSIDIFALVSLVGRTFIVTHAHKTSRNLFYKSIDKIGKKRVSGVIFNHTSVDKTS